MKRIAALAFACALAGFAAAQTDPVEALKQIDAYRQEAMQTVKTASDRDAVMAAVKQKAQDAIKGLDPTKVQPASAYDWGKLYSLAGEHKIVCDLTHLYLTTSPAPKQAFDDQMLMMQSCNALGEGKMLDATLVSVKPTNSDESVQLAEEAVYEFGDTIAKKEGPKQAIEAMDAVAKNLVFGDLKDEATQHLAQEKARLTARGMPVPSDDEILKTLTMRIQARNDNMKLDLVEEKCDILTHEDKLNEAKDTIKAFEKTLDPSSKIMPSAKALDIRLSMRGEAPPSLAFDHSYGDFKSLADWKGKVVIVDTFAHWCGPCKASFPDMRKLYDDLHAKGLEIVGVTSYYGFYGQEQKLAKDVEFAKMSGFRDQYNMNWPIIFGEHSNFDNYGVTGIPTTYIIGRDGKVADIRVGYDDADFKELRAEVEKLVGK